MSRAKNPVPEIRRAALYIRVSTEEQAKKGYSLPAQKEDLEQYAKKNGYAIAGYYIDEGKSARKKYTNRKEFMRMMEDVKADKIDVILFIKLDRWFRSVADYYKIQEILDAHGVAWKTTQEHYDTETTNGRLYINIRLSVAQDECDRDSDRIKFVFDSKVARGEPITGSMPLGLKIENKRIVRDPETAPAVEALFRHYKEHGTAGGAMRHIRDTYNISLYDHTVRRMLRNPMYKGMYRDNPDYCEAIIPPEEFDAIQQQLENRSIRSNPTGRVYIFSGLLVCGACGKKMSGHYTFPAGRQEYYLYRCRNAVVYHQCSNHTCMNEEKLEQWLLLNVTTELSKWQTEWGIEAARAPKPKIDRAAIQRKLNRLKDLYVDDLITMEQYREDFTRYNLMLQQDPDEPPPPPDFDGLRKLLTGNLPNTGSLRAPRYLAQYCSGNPYRRGKCPPSCLSEVIILILHYLSDRWHQLCQHRGCGRHLQRSLGAGYQPVGDHRLWQAHPASQDRLLIQSISIRTQGSRQRAAPLYIINNII